MFWRKPKLVAESAPAALPMTKELIARLHPEIAEAFRVDGAAIERQRIKAVYEIASLQKLEPLVERFMFDGCTPPEAAALAKIAAMQAQAVIVAEVNRRRADCEVSIH